MAVMIGKQIERMDFRKRQQHWGGTGKGFRRGGGTQGVNLNASRV